MRLIINSLQKEKEPMEINVSHDEAKMIRQFLLSGAEFLKLGNEMINTKYIIGLFEGGQRIDSNRMIKAPKEKIDTKAVREILEEMRKGLKIKGIIK